ncbi:MAG: hypothetical protein H8E66_33370, partial [Planctomycetes bacterium]|nr:hypothetical protein [Planctomycetota bacterium]
GSHVYPIAQLVRDSLELDLSSIRLREFLRESAALIQRGSFQQYQPAPLRLVPAPKTAAWTVENGWKPKDGDESVRLRPLAHMAVQDQALATAVLICLANHVETAQGNPELKIEKKTRKKVVSYGHRLVSTWDNDDARFRWGSAQLYRQYYVDYQTFVQRPERVREELIPSGKSWAIAQADLSQFYDRVKRKLLLEKIIGLVQDSETGRVDRQFFNAAERIFDWRWHAESVDQAVQGGCPERDGLPQGLAASGFFANVYLLAFDEALIQLFDKRPQGRSWRIIDYRRYVDDMRFVIQLGSTSPQKFQAEFEAFLVSLLDTHAPGLKLNADKTVVKYSHSHPSHAPLADAMQAVQTEISGPMDVETARQALEMLDGLLATSGQRRQRLEPKGTGQDEALMRTFSVEPDVRTETLERFVAHRWRHVFRSLRVMADADGLPDSSLNVGRMLLDRRAETFATELMRRWIDDPSNVRLLRVAMDIFPSPKHLELVLKLLEAHLEHPNHTKARAVCEYVGAELLRAGATETGFVRDEDELPSDSDVDGYRQLLTGFAERRLAAESQPWFMQQQALLFLAVVQASTEIDVPEDDPNCLYSAVHSLIRGEWPADLATDQLAIDRAMPLLIVNYRLTGDTDTCVKLLSQLLSQLSVAVAEQLLIGILTEDGTLFDALWTQLPTRDLDFWKQHLGTLGYFPDRPTDSWKPTEGSTAYHRLLAIISTLSNPFQQETAALRLCDSLARQWGTPKHREERGEGVLAPARIEVKCVSWKRLADPTQSLRADEFDVRIISDSEKHDERYDVPAWCDEKHRWKVEIGQVLRAAVLGQTDYSKNFYVPRVIDGIRKYQGIRSSWFKRKHGLYNERRALGSRFLPISPWFSELLFRLLRWPGTQSPHRLVELPNRFRASALLKIVNERLSILGQQYCRASEMPSYTFPAELLLNPSSNGQLKVAVVQSVIPHKNDLTMADRELNEPSYRRRHRRHLSSMLRVLKKILEVREGYKQQREHVDLVVFPELSVHVDDIPILIRFADTAKLMVFCGLVFHASPDDPNDLINSGLWILPVRSRLGRAIYLIEQGKQNLTPGEETLGITPYRPCQWIIEGQRGNETPWRITSAICYDATDLRLATDMRNQSDAFIVSALNQDIATFDTMVAALHYHMYQHVILVNTGEFGGTNAQAPYRVPWKKLLVHHHGIDEALVSVFDIDILHFRGRPHDSKEVEDAVARKFPPACVDR